MSAGLIFSEASVLDLWMTVFALSSHGLSVVHSCILIASYFKDNHHTGLGPTIKTILNTFVKTLSPQSITF